LRRRLRCVVSLGRLVAHGLTLGFEPLGFFLGALPDDALGLTGRSRLERGARGRSAGRKLRIVDAARAGTFQFGEQGAARIGRDCGDQIRARAQAEPVQRQGGVASCIMGHGVSLLEHWEEIHRDRESNRARP